MKHSPRAFGNCRHIVFCILAFVLIITGATGQAHDFVQKRHSYKTQLRRLGPAPQSYKEERLPEDVSEVAYPSGDLRLKAWLVNPKSQLEPAIVYFHGGFAFDLGDFRAAQPFIDAGYTVMFPFLRGENGNPGNFEMMYGEVDDALAATRWLSTVRPGGATKVAFFGHSVGGAVAELAALSYEGPLVLSGSVGSLYLPDTFLSWGDNVPFDATDENEVRLRIFVMNLHSMKTRHVAYLGSEEPQAAYLREYRALAARHDAPLSVLVVPGDHQTSVARAVRAFIGELRRMKMQ